jgi:hypothetical protein
MNGGTINRKMCRAVVKAMRTECVMLKKAHYIDGLQ